MSTPAKKRVRKFNPVLLHIPDADRPDITFTVPGEPVSKSRHRTGVRGGKVHHYQDTKDANAQKTVGIYYRQARGPGQPSEGGFGVDATFPDPRRPARDRRRAIQ